MYAFPIGGVDVVLRAQWLRTLGTFAMNLEELFIKFKLEGKVYKLHGSTTPPPTHVISSHIMEKLIKKGSPGIISRCYSIEGYEEHESITPEWQGVLSHHSKVFKDLPRALPPEREQDHAIELLA